MATTIEQAVHPLILTASVLGVGGYSSKKLYLSVLYNLTVWITYGCLCYYMVNMLNIEALLQTTYAIIDIIIGILTSITCATINIYINKRFQIFIKRLAAVDNTLEELGTRKIYRKLHIYAKGLLLGWLTCGLVANMCDMTWWFYAKEDRRYLIVPYVTNYFYHINLFMDLLFLTFLWYIGTGFDKINEHLACLLIKEKHESIRRKAIPITHRYIMCTDNYKHVLWTSMHLHLELCQIARQLNVMFGIQITMEMLAYVIVLTRLCNHIFIHIQTKGRFTPTMFTWIGLYYWIFLHVAKIFFSNYICETVSAKSNKIEGIIHQLTDLDRYADIRDEVNQFILQVMHHPLRFTGLDLFYFGNSFLRKIVMIITTLVIIIIQMSNIPKVYNGI